MKFVQIGERIKGKIKKNEQFPVSEFVNKVTYGAFVIPQLSFMERMIPSRFKSPIRKSHMRSINQIEKNIRDLIDQDEFGSKRSKKKKGKKS